MASVKHSPGEPKPEAGQRPEKGTKIPASIAAQDSGHILPDKPSRLESLGDPTELEREAASLRPDAAPRPRGAEFLTGRSADEQVDASI